MKRIMIAVLLAFVLSTVAFAGKKKEKDVVAPWRDGKLVYHPVVYKDLLAGIPDSELFHDGDDDYLCITGHDNVGPTCHKREDWIIHEKEAYTEFFAADGTLLYDVERNTNFMNVFAVASTQWFLVADGRSERVELDCHAGKCKLPDIKPGLPTDKRTEVVFRYRIRVALGRPTMQIAVPGTCKFGCTVTNTGDGFMLLDGEVPSDFPMPATVAKGGQR